MKTCQNCKQENLDNAICCSACGMEFPQSVSASKTSLRKKVDPLALTSFILSIWSIPGVIIASTVTLLYENLANQFDVSFSNWAILKTIFFDPAIFAAIALGILSLVYFRRGNFSHTGKGLAIAGISIAGLVLIVVLVFLLYPLIL
ncbi:MAG: hypothetical protein GYA58_01900 [Anaerolineaceae bacterium]|jgi:hypothetical protein|nr:hypothetical protein [Anaerolineaceae bacterium]